LKYPIEHGIITNWVWNTNTYLSFTYFIYHSITK
jgi:hypothetical protein